MKSIPSVLYSLISSITHYQKRLMGTQQLQIQIAGGTSKVPQSQRTQKKIKIDSPLSDALFSSIGCLQQRMEYLNPTRPYLRHRNSTIIIDWSSIGTWVCTPWKVWSIRIPSSFTLGRMPDSISISSLIERIGIEEVNVAGKEMIESARTHMIILEITVSNDLLGSRVWWMTRSLQYDYPDYMYGCQMVETSSFSYLHPFVISPSLTERSYARSGRRDRKSVLAISLGSSLHGLLSREFPPRVINTCSNRCLLLKAAV